MSAVLEARAVRKTYRGGDNELVEVLNQVDVEVARGEVVAVVGASGAGKSTLLRLLSFVERPTHGELTLDGRPVRTAAERRRARRRVTLVEQQPLLFDMSVTANLAYGLKLADRRGAITPSRMTVALERAGAADLAGRPARTLSVGQVQRVAVARALANGPKLLLADEPTASLDPKGTAAVLEALRLARTTFGTAEVVATHDAEVREIATQEYLLEEGVLRPRSG